MRTNDVIKHLHLADVNLTESRVKLEQVVA